MFNFVKFIYYFLSIFILSIDMGIDNFYFGMKKSILVYIMLFKYEMNVLI